jgi:CheY-like chemotaxis protein
MSRVRVLMIDDSEDDAELLATVFAQSKTEFDFEYVLDSEAGLARLAAAGHEIRLVLLDIKMTGRDGMEVLAQIRRTAPMKHLPVVVLSSSDAPSDVLHSYRLGANAYVQKPDDLAGCRKFVANLAAFWLETASLP